MANVINFVRKKLKPELGEPSPTRTYHIEISAFPGNYLEFTANGVKTDGKSLTRIADELEKIASIIRTDVITTSEASPS